MFSILGLEKAIWCKMCYLNFSAVLDFRSNNNLNLYFVQINQLVILTQAREIERKTNLLLQYQRGSLFFHLNFIQTCSGWEKIQIWNCEIIPNGIFPSSSRCLFEIVLHPPLILFEFYSQDFHSFFVQLNRNWRLIPRMRTMRTSSTTPTIR